MAGTETKVVDLGGKCLLPGLIEPHSHPIVSALLYDWIDVSGFQDISGAAIMDKLRQAAKQAEPGKWIAAFGYDPILTRDLKALNADILDQISTNQPRAGHGPDHAHHIRQPRGPGAGGHHRRHAPA